MRRRRVAGPIPVESYDWRSCGIPYARQANGLIARGVVLKVKAHDDPKRQLPKGKSAPTVAASGYLCDVLLYTPIDMCTVLREVPIAVSSGGLNDHEIWCPREAGIDVSTAPLTISNPASTLASRAQDMDGDHVLISFLDNDLNKPIITGQVTHPKNQRKASVSDATQYKYRRIIRGNLFGVTTGGDIEIDTTQASDGATSPTGVEIPDPTAGNIAITMKTNSVLQVLASIASAPEPAIMTDAFLADLTLALTEVSVFMKAWGVPTTNLDNLIKQMPNPAFYRSAHLEHD